MPAAATLASLAGNETAAGYIMLAPADSVVKTVMTLLEVEDEPNFSSTGGPVVISHCGFSKRSNHCGLNTCKLSTCCRYEQLRGCCHNVPTTMVLRTYRYVWVQVMCVLLPALALHS